MLAEYAAEILPAGVLNVITGDGEPVGAGIVRHPDVRMVSLTGDVATGKEVARAAAETLKRVHLELGGKAPVLVFDDADPAAVAEGIKTAGYWNSGQDCTAASRVVAGPKIYDKLLAELVPAVESLRVGDPADSDEVEMGPMISKEQQERVFAFLERAGETKARVLTAATRTGAGASSSSRPSSSTSSRRTRSFSARSSALSSPCSASRTTIRRSRGRTTSRTASPPRSGHAMSAAR
jgi:betaine-aldehyde dehydrogenase/aminobutyraldehyde dehydrogenase